MAEQNLDYYRSLSMASQKDVLSEKDVSHYHTFTCDVCKRVVQENETAGFNVGLYPADINAFAITGLVCSKKCVLALVDSIKE